MWLALALFREAVNSGSNFYAFLCYYKILDLVFPKLKDRKNWLNNVAPGQTSEKERLLVILQNTKDLEKYFREERLNAIKHVFKVEIVAKHFAKEQCYQQEQKTNGGNGQKHTE